MTIAVVHSTRTPPYRLVWAATDSRLTLRNDAAAIDGVPKILDLFPRTMIIVAGSRLPWVCGVEIARSFLISTEEALREQGRRLAVWDIARIVSFFADQCFQSILSTNADARSEAVICGFNHDDTPGMVRTTLRASESTRATYRPTEGRSSNLVLGAPEAAPLMRAALDRLKGMEDGFESLLSVLMAMIEHDGLPYRSIGGCPAAAVLHHNCSITVRPLIELDGRVLLHGQSFAASLFRSLDGVHRHVIKRDTSLFNELEKEGASVEAEAPLAEGPLADAVDGDSVFGRTVAPASLLGDQGDRRADPIPLSEDLALGCELAPLIMR